MWGLKKKQHIICHPVIREKEGVFLVFTSGKVTATEDKVFIDNFLTRIERVRNDGEEKEIDLGQYFSSLSPSKISLPSLSSTRSSSSPSLSQQEIGKVAGLRQVNNIW